MSDITESRGKWSLELKLKLQQKYAELTIDQIKQEFPNIDPSNVRRMANKMGLKKRPEVISAHARQAQVAMISVRIANNSEKRRGAFSLEEDKLVRALFQVTKNNSEVAAQLPGRTVKDINQYAKEVGLKRATPEKAEIMPRNKPAKNHHKVGRRVPSLPKKEEEKPWWKEPHNSDKYKQGWEAYCSNKQPQNFIDNNGRVATIYKVAA